MKALGHEAAERLIADLKFDGSGLVTVVVQEALTGRVIMLAHADAEAIRKTFETGLAHFHSRSRNLLWKKGETSGHVLHVHDVHVDCDGDALLYRASAAGPACHTGAESCFFTAASAPSGVPAVAPASDVIDALARVIASRQGGDPATSYTAKLLSKGPGGAAKKVVEEAGELAMAAVSESQERVASEAADLIYHLLVTLTARGIGIDEVRRTLATREGIGGLVEKAARQDA